MGTYRTYASTGIRAAALIGVLPGAIVAAAYLLALTGHLYQRWDARTAVVLGMAMWGVLGVMELWHEYVRQARKPVSAERPPVNPRVVLFVWALILATVALSRADTHPWMAAFLAVAAMYSLGRTFGLERYFTRRSTLSHRAAVARSSSGERARPRKRLRTGERARAQGGERSRARNARAAAVSST